MKLLLMRDDLAPLTSLFFALKYQCWSSFLDGFIYVTRDGTLVQVTGFLLYTKQQDKFFGAL